jgi:putative spermidine/putrescine transport system ATP-binding protein
MHETHSASALANSSRNSRNAHSHVEFKNVSKAYGAGKSVVESLNLDVRKGEFLTLLGPSGSGKTTTLMMLAGFETPSAGEIWLAGQRIEHLPPHQRNIGIVFQNYALFPHMTVAQNVAFPLDVRKFSTNEKKAKVKAALERVRLAEFADRKPAQLSGGQQQRVALARALVFDPPLVLMDEPLGALDKKLRESLQLEIKRIHRESGTTFVYVTHDQTEAMTMSDRVAVFNEGRVQQCAVPHALYDAPCNRFVAGFLGENNFFDGRVIERNGEHVRVELIDGSHVDAKARGDCVITQRVSVSVRPEALRLATQPDAANVIRGTVLDVIYLGDQARVICRFGNGDPTNEFSMRLPDTKQAQSMERGSVLHCEIDRQRALALTE